MRDDPVPFSHPWDEKLLGSVAKVIVGGTPSTLVPSFWNGDIAWMSSGDVHLRRIIDVPGRITTAGLQASSAKMVDHPAVAIALAGQGRTRGTVALSLTKLCTNQSVALIQVDPNVLSTEYLFHCLDNRYEELRARSAGGGRAGLSKSIIERIPLPLPPLFEQRRIAEILDTVDETIRKTEELIAKLKQVKAGLLHGLLTRGIDEHGRLRDPVAHPEQFKDSSIGRIPREWNVRRLGHLLTSVEAGKSPDCPDQPASIGEWGVLKVSAVHPDGLRAQENKVILDKSLINSEYEISSGDLLISRANTFELVGLTCLVLDPPPRLMLSDKTLRLDMDQRCITNAFASIAMQTPITRLQIQSNSTGTSGSMKNVSQAGIRTIELPLPTLPEQQLIYDIVKSWNQRIDNEQAMSNKLKQLKNGLMADLLSARVRVDQPKSAEVIG